MDSDMISPSPAAQVHIKDLLRVLLARRWVGATTFLLIVLAALLWVLIQTPVYRATGLLLIEPDKVNMGPSQDLDLTLDYAPSYLDRQEYYETQYKLLSSISLQEKIFTQFGFADKDEFRTAKEPLRGFGKLFRVSPVPRTRLVQVSFEWPERELAARTVGALLEQFVIDHRGRTQGITLSGLQALRAKRDELRPKVETKADQLQNFMMAAGAVSLEDQSNITVQRLKELQENVSNSERDFIEARSRYEGIRRVFDEGRPLDEVPDLLVNLAIRDLKLQLSRAHQQISDLSEKFGPNHPELVAAQARLSDGKAKLDAEIRQSLGTAEAQYEQTQRQLNALKEQLAAQEKVALALSRQKVQYEQLRRDHDLLRKTYMELCKRVEDVEITLETGSRHDNVLIVEPPRIPVDPARPRRRLIMAGAGFFAFCMAVGMCFLVDYLDTTVKTKDDVERLTGLPVIGYVPAIRSGDMDGLKVDGKTLAHELLSVVKPRSQLAESFRSIRTAIDFSSVGGPLRRLMVSSSSPSEGKTLTSSNIAVTMAQAGRRVLLVDADMRRHRVHEVFGVSSRVGLSNLLIGENTESDIVASIMPVPELKGLSVMASGPKPPNPAELLAGPRFGELLDRLNQTYDVVIVDTPPILNVTDAAVVAKHVDGIVLVIRAFATQREMLRRARDLFAQTRTRVLGCILNSVDVPTGGYYAYDSYQYYSNEHYYSYYGDGDGKTRKKRRRRARKKGGKEALSQQAQSELAE